MNTPADVSAFPPNHPRLLEGIRGPADVKALSADQLPQLAREIRDEIIAVTARNGGHVGPNLGVVELSSEGGAVLVTTPIGARTGRTTEPAKVLGEVEAMARELSLDGC